MHKSNGIGQKYEQKSIESKKLIKNILKLAFHIFILEKGILHVYEKKAPWRKRKFRNYRKPL